MLGFAIEGFPQSHQIPVDSVPSLAMSHFRQNYTHSTKVTWYFNDDDNYQVTFIRENLNCLSLFDKNGIWLETYQQLPLSLLPQNISEIMNERFKDFKVLSLKSKTTPRDEMVYEIVIKKAIEVYVLTMSKEGYLLNKIAEHN
jgi:hypothetical protein